MVSEVALFELGVLFAAVALVGGIANYLRQSVIPFYIGAGILLGPYVVGRLTPYALEATEFVELGAELGIVFLLFFLGLEFNLNRLLANRSRIGKAGTVDLVVNFGGGLILGFVLFRAILPAFLVAGIVYISSSAIITKSLIDLGWIANDEAEPMLGTLVYEDLVIAVYLVVASALLLGGGDIGAAVQSIGLALGVILLLLIVVWFGTPFFERVLDADSHEFIVLRAVGITVLTAGAALALGVSEAVAAFFIGMAFSSTEHVEQLERLLEPIRDLFAAIFFVWIGLVTDPLVFAGVLTLILIAVVLTVPTKLISGYFGGRIYNLNIRQSTRVGLGMTTRGEFSLIIATLALSGAGTTLTEPVAQTIYAFAVGYVLVMSIVGTMLMQYSTPIEAAVVSRLSGFFSDSSAKTD
ncbi:cation:proton antiporter [Haloplanus pelagicus]|uniref:cation:proton antiporter n=1 Tax=Haloplanus pelagicus TaxID=2949995 RepID=UPI00203F7DA4|nr:cation:proton antiporter [Haloplanus sp. HW8-1]